MGRPRLYDSDAARQRACRARRAERLVEVDRRALEGLHQRLERLKETVLQAAHRGDPLAWRCRSASAETVVEKLTAAFEERSPPPEASGALAPRPARAAGPR